MAALAVQAFTSSIVKPSSVWLWSLVISGLEAGGAWPLLPPRHSCKYCLQSAIGEVMAKVLTTHVGSLPRGNDLIPLLLARDQGRPYDAATFERLTQSAVDEAVAKQEAAGVSIVSDGELGKVGYPTYIKERLSGFGGNVTR